MGDDDFELNKSASVASLCLLKWMNGRKRYSSIDLPRRGGRLEGNHRLQERIVSKSARIAQNTGKRLTKETSKHSSDGSGTCE